MTYELQHIARVRELEAELSSCRQDAAMVIHALDCAVQLVAVLIAFMPDGSPIHPGVATAKDALDDAMAAIHGRRRSPSHE
jgi:hypothetical protein